MFVYFVRSVTYANYLWHMQKSSPIHITISYVMWALKANFFKQSWHSQSFCCILTQINRAFLNMEKDTFWPVTVHIKFTILGPDYCKSQHVLKKCISLFYCTTFYTQFIFCWFVCFSCSHPTQFFFFVCVSLNKYSWNVCAYIHQVCHINNDCM